MTPWLSIVGLGEDGLDGIAPPARLLIEQAEILVGAARHLAMAPADHPAERLQWSSPLEATIGEIIARRGRRVCILATGDPMWYGIGATLAGLIVLCLKLPAFKGWVPYRWFRRPDWRAVRDLVKIGLPTSLQILAESSAFVMATVIIGWMGANALAAHNVAMTCAAVIFMVPLGVSQALTVRIGEAMGARSYHRWRPMVVSGWLLGIAFTVCSATAFVVANDSIARLFLPEEAETAAVVASLLLVAAAFQMGDALQILSAGGLRGLNDVNVPAWMAFVAYWAISIPLGWFFSFPLGMGVYGMWWGITVGLGLTAVTLGTRLWIKTGVNRFPKESMEAGDAK